MADKETLMLGDVPLLGKNLAVRPSLTPSFVLYKQNQESYDSKQFFSIFSLSLDNDMLKDEYPIAIWKSELPID